MIAQSFMGLSHEWPYIEEMYDIPQYVDIIKLLQSYGSGPLSLRIGGGSTDMQKTVPGPAVWDALSKLHKATGMTYILGLNFYNQDVTLAKNQMDAAKKGLPEGSIQSFEIGNEVRACLLAAYLLAIAGGTRKPAAVAGGVCQAGKPAP